MDRRRILVASDSFKGTYSSLEVAQLVKENLSEDEYEVDVMEVSDGGEGFCHALTEALGGEYVSLHVHDPLMRTIASSYGIKDETAIIEIAKASGLTLLQPHEYDPWNASSFGTGELLVHAIRKGCRKFIVGLGGSATSDCGRGMLEALCDIPEIQDCEFLIASDVQNPLCGPQGAARVFAPQKGADQALVERLEERTLMLGRELERNCGKNLMNTPGAGAAGGLGAAFLSLYNSHIQSGIDLVLDAQHFEERVRKADLVLTGEGRIDSQTLLGKAPYRIALRAAQVHVPCVALYGQMTLSPEEQAQSPWSGFHPVGQIGNFSTALHALFLPPYQSKTR